MGIKVANNAVGVLAAGISDSDVTITVQSGQGARFPVLSAGDYFYATLINTSNQLEIVKCTARSGDVLTVVRAQEATAARAYDVGDRIEIRITAATFEDATDVSAELALKQDAATAVTKDSATGAALMPVGTTAQRPASPVSGMIRQNSTTAEPEWYDAVGDEWVTFSDRINEYRVDYLVVGGGGGGGATHGGGGGAGGFIAASSAVTSGSNFSITVGAGGAGGVGQTSTGGRGGDGGSTGISSIATALGGGGGPVGFSAAGPGNSGGSGSGAGASATVGQVLLGGFGTGGQGNAGGNSLGGGAGPTTRAGGGGGAGSTGVSGTSSSVGNGGNGSVWLDGVVYAGGGGGGSDKSGNSSGGSGIGGGGAASGGGGNAVVNRGSGGGGGGGGTGSGGAGSSGIVIIRYEGAQRGTGGTVTSSGGFTIHTFTSSGTYTA